MQTAVAKWGNSLALRLPRTIASDVDFTEGTPVDLSVRGKELVVTPTRKKYKLEDLLAQFKPEHRRKEEDFGQPVGEEVW